MERTVVRVLVCLGIIATLVLGARAVSNLTNAVGSYEEQQSQSYEEVQRMMRGER